jgi:hypothetical protein
MAPVKRVFEGKPLGASKILALATVSSVTTPLLFKQPVQCQGNTYNVAQQETFLN